MNPDDSRYDNIFESKVHNFALHWKARFIVSVIMLGLALLGLVVTDFRPTGTWDYWRLMVPVYAILTISLSWYLRHKAHIPLRGKTIGQDVLQWVGLFTAVYLLSLLVDAGIMGRMPAGFVVLTMLALTLFWAGIYVDASFMLIGITLGFLVAAAGLVTAYLSVIMIPVVIVALIIILFIVRRTHPPESAG
ncbi:MAG TPA: hypothetical protein VJB02_06115 [Coxiellaceae bacterium]|nr:hypothetical protein [Coxiellaceae bacterium]